MSNKNIEKSSIIIFCAIILSRIAGFLRDSLIANIGSQKADILNSSLTSVNLIYNLLLGGAISASMIPYLSSKLVKNEEKEGWVVVSSFINFVFISMSVLCILGTAFAPAIVSITSPGFVGIKREMTITVMRILFPATIFLMLSGLFGGIMNAYKRFAYAAFGPAIYNLGTAISVFCFDTGNSLELKDVYKISIGILVSSIVYMFIQLLASKKNLNFYKFIINWHDIEFRNLSKLAIPSLFASLIIQLNLLISQSFTSCFEHGSITAYANSNNIWQLTYGIFAMGLGIAILPYLSEFYTLKKHSEFISLISNSINKVLFFIMPSIIGIFLFGKEILCFVYRWSSRYDIKLLELSKNMLLIFTISLLTQSILAIVNRVFYSMNDTKTPLKVGGFSLIINVILCSAFMFSNIMDASGMVLSSSIASIFTMVILVNKLKQKIKDLKFINRECLKIFICSIGMLLVGIIVNLYVKNDVNFEYTSASKIFMSMIMMLKVIIVCLAYFVLCVIFKVENIKNILNRK